MRINFKFYAAILFTFYSSLIIYYHLPFGIMDDFKNLEHIKNLNQDFFVYYFDYFKERTFEKGLLQPFYLLQMYFQYSLNSPLLIYIQNLFIVFLSHYLFISGVSNYVKLNYFISLLIFLIYPFSNDLLMHPSLQEKYAFLIFGLVLILISRKSKFKKLIFLLSLAVPLIKLQGTVLIFIIFSIYKSTKSLNSLYAILGFIFGILLQTYVTFFVEAEYSIRNSFDNVFSNLQHPVNVIYLLLIFTYLFFLFRQKETNLVELSIAFSSLAILFIYINFYILGYLLSTYAYFISIMVPFIMSKFEEKFSKFEVKQITTCLILLIFSVSQFFIPRLERWSDLGEVYETLQTTNYGNIYYCSEEGTIFINKFIKKDNKLIFVNSLNEIEPSNIDYLVLTDDFQCNSFGMSYIGSCVDFDLFKSKHSRMKIKKISC